MQFPVGVSGCLSDSDCARGAPCDLVLKGGNFTWCHCPDMYDPLDNCQSHYYDNDTRARYTAMGANLLINGAGFAVLAVLIFRAWLHEWRVWRHQGVSWPRPMYVLTSSVMLLAVLSIISAFLYIAGLGNVAKHVQSVTTNVFVGSVVSLWYFSLVLMVRTKDMGHFARKWRILSYVVAVAGSVGLFVSLLAGLFRSFFREYDAVLSVFVILGMVVGIFVPIAIITPVYAITLHWLHRQSRDESTALTILWRCIWISLAETIMMIVTFIILLSVSGAYPASLPDNVTARILYTTILSQLNAVLVVILIRVSFNGRRRKGITSSGFTPSSSAAPTTTASTALAPVAPKETESLTS